MKNKGPVYACVAVSSAFVFFTEYPQYDVSGTGGVCLLLRPPVKAPHSYHRSEQS